MASYQNNVAYENSSNPHASGRPKRIKPEIHARLEPVVMEEFSRSDFHKANMRTIAKRAGVSFGTIYQHYGSKEGLVFAFVDERLAELTERMIDHLKGLEDLKEKLRKVFWVQLDYYERFPALGRILFMTCPMETWMADRTFKQKRMFNIFLDVLRQGQREGILNPNLRARVLLDFIYGFIIRSFCMWIYCGSKTGLAEQANDWFEIVWRGISCSKDDSESEGRVKTENSNVVI